MPSLQACVLAAGKGTRMGGDRPKVLFEANGKPLLEWVLGALSDAGTDDCVVVVGFRKEDVVPRLPTGVRWAEQSPQLGTGHAVRCARASFQSSGHDAPNLIVTCGDMPLVAAATYRALVAERSRLDADAVLLTVTVPEESHFGRVVRDKSGAVARIVEHKDASEGERAITEGNAGVYCFRPAALWPALEQIGTANAQGEYYLTDVIAIILAGGGRVVSVPSRVAGEELGVNTPAELELAGAALARRGVGRGAGSR